MNYSLSKKILDRVKESKNILLVCHKSPDGDGIASTLSLFYVIRRMSKKVKMVCIDKIFDQSTFLPNSGLIEKVNFKDLDFSKFDLLIAAGSPKISFVSGDENLLPKIFTIVIDHHKDNPRFGNLNLIDEDISSTCELLYLLFKDWKLVMDKTLATSLLAGIITDTGAFQYQKANQQTLLIAADLIGAGADKEEIILNFFRTKPLELFKFWSLVFSNLKVDKVYPFAWVAIPFEQFSRYKTYDLRGSQTASMFFQSVAGTNFGILMTEKSKNELTVEIRTRTNFDVSRIAKLLGGGGHTEAAGVRITGLSFERAVKKVLQVVRKFAKENAK